MSSVVLTALSSMALLLLWAWTAYHLLVLVLGWPHSKAFLRRPLDLGTLRNPVDLPSSSVIVVAKDEENVVGATLERVAALQYPRDRFQILVAEDGSTDDTRAICEAFARAHPGTLILHEDASGGKGAALNRAMRHATGEVLLFLDADSVFDEDLLLRAAKFFHDHPEVHAAQALLETYAERPNLVAQLDRYETLIWYRGIVAGKDRLRLFVPLCGTGMFVRRRALEAAGPWNEDSLAEDVEMAVRLATHGTRIRMLPAVVKRQPPYTARDFLAQRQRWWGGALQALSGALGALRSPQMARRQKADMLLQLVSPLVVVGGTAYLLSAILLGAAQMSGSDLLSTTLIGVTSSQLLLLGLIIGHAVSRRQPSILTLIPGLYVYWGLQLAAVVTVVFALALGRPPRWRVTAKRSLATRTRLASPSTGWPLGDPPVAHDGDGIAFGREGDVEGPK